MLYVVTGITISLLSSRFDERRFSAGRKTETSTSIAVDYDCAGSTINKLMSKHGVRKQTHEKTVRWIDKGKVWALHDAGWDVV
ncbi:MAG: hypothetical protein IKF46_07590 [Erysipelotrichaceae bacterium]|nr:hypothetical protein [Erysipelotrichaceae bacterium]